MLITTMKINPTNLIVSGGVFYNVRLNFWLADVVPGKLCVYPLSGDQGNAIGLYSKHNPDFVFPDNINWGLRDLSEKVPLIQPVPGLFFVDSEAEALPLLNDALANYGYVNLVRGAMEFGPRALCNTSTLALPMMEYVEKINFANGRNTVMPMAPVMTRKTYHEIFHLSTKLHKSEKFMVASLAYREGKRYSGAAHLYPDGTYTGRPQVIDNDWLMESLLQSYGILINTSFNIHGQPIVYGVAEAIAAHVSQTELDPSFITVIIRN